MRNSRKRLRLLGTAMTLAVALMGIQASQAAAAAWSPQGASVTGSTFSSFAVQFHFGFAVVNCKSTMTGQTGGANLATTGVTLPQCSSGYPLTIATAGTASGWTVTANTTSTATVSIPSGGLKLTKPSCTITIGSGAFGVPAQWSNAVHNLTIAAPGASLPYTSTGSCNVPPSGTVHLSTNTGGWVFPATLSIV